MTPASERLPAELEPLRQQCIELNRAIHLMPRSETGKNLARQEHTTDMRRKWNSLMDQYVRLAREAGATEIYINDFICLED